MEGLRQYVLSSIAAAFISGIIVRLTQNNGSKEFVRVLCGAFMTIVLILPISGNREKLWDNLIPDIGNKTEALIDDGTRASGNMRAEIIKQRTEAYILDRASAMDAQIKVSVSLGKDSIPKSVRITGRITPMNRSRLTDVIAADLGIPREQQEWIG